MAKEKDLLDEAKLLNEELLVSCTTLLAQGFLHFTMVCSMCCCQSHRYSTTMISNSAKSGSQPAKRAIDRAAMAVRQYSSSQLAGCSFVAHFIAHFPETHNTIMPCQVLIDRDASQQTMLRLLDLL